MAKKQHSQKQFFYVGINDPIEIRRSLLESSKEMLQLLKRNEKFKEVRKEKKENISRLKDDMKEIKKLFAKLKSLLPVHHLRIILKAEKDKLIKQKVSTVKKKKTVAKKKVAAVTKQKVNKEDLSELKKLEQELANIENKLGGLV